VKYRTGVQRHIEQMFVNSSLPVFICMLSVMDLLEVGVIASN